MNRTLRNTLALLLFTVPLTVQAHATLVFGELSTEPEVPVAGEPFTLLLHMMDPVRTPIEDATVWAEFRYMPPEEAERRLAGAGPAPTAEEVEAGEVEVDIPEGAWLVLSMEETGPGGNYAATVHLPEAGHYQLIMRDTTYPQEDAVAELLLEFSGTGSFGPELFIFPPTDIGGASLTTWLIWLVAIPVVAGVIVTVIVLGRKPEDGRQADRS